MTSGAPIMTNPKAVATPNAKDASANKATGGQEKSAAGAVAADAIAPKPEAVKPEVPKQEVPQGKKDGSTADAEWLQMIAAKQDKDAAAPTKMVVATEIYKRMSSVKGVTRKDIIQKFIEEVKLIKAGASTYYQMFKAKNGLLSKK
ncbi:hypothetical protein GCM10009080_14280 [Cupriavidus pauculus]|jgi:hypothetical protein